MEKYPLKILLALTESIKGSRKFFEFLLHNGFPELAAFSNAVRGDVGAMKWLFQNNYAWLAILSNAIDGEDKARVWIARACHPVNINFALACRDDVTALRWLKERDLQVFLNMAHEVAIVLETQAVENVGPYVMHFDQGMTEDDIKALEAIKQKQRKQ